MASTRFRSIFACCGLLALAGLLSPLLAAADSEAVARRLLNSQGCKACHPFESAEESLAPDLSRVGGRLKKEQIRSRLVSADHRHAAGRIADFSHLGADDIDALASFLSQRQ